MIFWLIIEFYLSSRFKPRTARDFSRWKKYPPGYPYGRGGYGGRAVFAYGDILGARFFGFWFLSLSVLCGFLFFNFDENLPPIGEARR